MPVQLRVQTEQFGVACVDAGGKWYEPEPPFHAPENQLRKHSRFVVLNTFGTNYVLSYIRCRVSHNAPDFTL